MTQRFTAMNQETQRRLIPQPALVALRPYFMSHDSLEGYPTELPWLAEYRERVANAAEGKTQKQYGLDKEDVWQVVRFARDHGIVKTNRLNRGKGYCQQRSSKQLRATLKHHLAEITSKLMVPR